MNYTSANKMVKLKLDRNKQLIRILNIESKIAKLEMVKRVRLVVFNNMYIEGLEKINTIEQNQLITYSLERENEIILITNDLNSKDIQIEDLQADILKLQKDFLQVISEINTMNASIPTHGIITNYRT